MRERSTAVADDDEWVIRVYNVGEAGLRCVLGRQTNRRGL